MSDDVVLNKAQIIERCLKRVAEEYEGDPKNLTENITRQDSILLNLERACQAAIDLGMRLVKLKELGVPNESRDAFVLLEKAGLLEAKLSVELQAMVGFRNTVVHEYQRVQLAVVQRVIETKLTRLTEFVGIGLRLT